MRNLKKLQAIALAMLLVMSTLFTSAGATFAAEETTADSQTEESTTHENEETNLDSPEGNAQESDSEEPIEKTPPVEEKGEEKTEGDNLEDLECVASEEEECVSSENKEEECMPSAEDKCLTPEEEVELLAVKAGIVGAITGNILTSAKLSFEDLEGNPITSPTFNSVVTVDYAWALENKHGYMGGSTYTFKLPAELKVYNTVDNEEMKDSNGEKVGAFSVTMDGTATITFTDYIESHSNITGTLQVISTLSEKVIVTGDKEITITPIEGGDSITIPLTYGPGGLSVEKSGQLNKAYNSETIEWTVDFNKTLEKVENAVLSDPIQEGQAIQSSSIKLYHLIVKLDGSVSQGVDVNTSEYEIVKTADGVDFAIDFKSDINTAYRAVYTTDITNQDQTEFKNKATLLSNGKNVGEAEAPVHVKRGAPLEKKSIKYDAATQTITWEIKYNYNEKNIASADALLKDFFNGSQELIKDSFVVQKIKIGENGNESGFVGFTNFTTTPKSEGDKKGFELQFNEDINSAYKIVYKTKATERVFDREEIVNKVTVGGHEKEGRQPIKQQILSKGHGAPNYKDKTIEWIIEFNKDSHEMSNLILTDVFTNKGLTLHPDTINITTGTGGTTLKKDIDYKLLKNEKDEFVIEFLKTIDKPHKITYTTDFDYEKREDKNLTYLQNKVTLVWDDKNGKEQTKEVIADFKPDGYTQSNGFKNGSYNAVTKEITWNIGVNYNLKTLKKASVEDFILGNQKLVEDSLVVFEMSLTGGANGTEVKELVPGEDYSIDSIEKDGKLGFSVKFKNEITKPYMITYKTSLKDLNFVEKKYENTATVYNDLVKETDLNASVSIPHGGTYAAKSGFQNGKIINWLVNINFAQSQVSNATIVDTPNADQSVLKDTIILYKTTLNESGAVTKDDTLIEGVHYTLDFKEDQEPFSFEIKFKNQINEPYILEYQSFILKASGDITNKVVFTGEHVDEKNSTTTSKVTVKKTTGMGDGGGNTGGLKVTKTDGTTDAKLVGAKFILKDKDSGITVKTGTTDANGELQFDRLLYGDYLLIEDEAPEGYLKNSTPIEININSVYVKGDLEKVGNPVTVTNNQIVRAVQLTKVDSEDKSKTLKGANFELQKKDGDKFTTIGLFPTNDDGVIYKDGLEPGDYQFIERIAPSGYEIDDTPILFRIEENQLKVLVLQPVVNVKLESVELTKVDADDKAILLEGAIFELLDATGATVQSDISTNKDGKLFVQNLKPGKYQFVEKKAPLGYELDSTPIKFTIVKGQTVALEMTNKRIPPTPGEPGKPVEPGEPEEPGKPVEPGEPEEPGKPEEPDKPEEPGKPGEPGKPEEPGNPGDQSNIELPNNPNDSNKPNPDAVVNSNTHSENSNTTNPDKANSGHQHAKSPSKNNGPTLPQTGEAYPIGSLLAGLGGILMGAWLLLGNLARRKTNVL